jgi:putative ABC transport system permease protein
MRWYQRFFRRELTEKHLDAELRFHLEHRIADLVDGGMAPEEARRQARLEFGGLDQVKEECRDVGGSHLIETFIQDLRYGLRQLRRNPGFSVVAILTIALGVGANAAIFSVVYGIVFRPLPYRDPGRLAAIWEHWIDKPGRTMHVSLPDFKDWKAQNTVFDGLAAYGYNRYDIRELEGGGGVRAAMVTPFFFSLFGVKPYLGRELGPADDRERVVVLSFELYQRLNPSNENIIGRSLRLGDHEYTVVGVMPPEFRLPTPDVEMWMSFADIYSTSGSAGVANWVTSRHLHGYGVLARLKKGISSAQAQTQMNAIELRLAGSYPDDDKGIGVAIVPLRTQIIGDVRNALLLLLGAVGLILLIACANVANLMLARATVRERETTIRRALGASAGRLVRLILTESLILGLMGGACGVLAAFWGVAVFIRLSPQNIPRIQDIRVDGPVLFFALGATLLASLLFSLAPVLRALGPRLNAVLHEGGRGAAGHLRAHRLQGSLVVTEVALATLLVTGAGLMLNSFIRLATLDAGFPPDHLLTFDLGASLARYRTPLEQTQYFNEVLHRVRALPGVKAVGACTSMPPDISQQSDNFQITGVTPSEEAKRPEAWFLPATPGFLNAVGLPMIEGRDFSEADNANAPPVAIISQGIANVYFRHEDPLGQKVHFSGVDRTIIGVAADTTYEGLGAPPSFQIYVPYAQSTFPGMHFAVRTDNDPLSQIPAIRAVVRSVDSEALAGRIATMEELLSRSILQPRFYTSMFAVFGLVALALASVGILGVISYSVSQRTQEIGVRMALGARKNDILRMVVGQGFKLTIIGIGIGFVGAFAFTRFMANLLYAVKPTDPLTFIVVSLILTAVALLASYIPARRATKVDPMVALRYE